MEKKCSIKEVDKSHVCGLNCHFSRPGPAPDDHKIDSLVALGKFALSNGDESGRSVVLSLTLQMISSFFSNHRVEHLRSGRCVG